MKHWYPDIIGDWVIEAGCSIEKDLDLAAVLQIYFWKYFPYIYQLAKFGDLMSWDSKDIFKNAPCLMY